MKNPWNDEARRILKAELARRDVSYKALSKALEAVGVGESPRQLTNKINRGTFTFAFFLRCMKALGVRDVRLF